MSIIALVGTPNTRFHAWREFDTWKQGFNQIVKWSEVCRKTCGFHVGGAMMPSDKAREGPGISLFPPDTDGLERIDEHRPYVQTSEPLSVHSVLVVVKSYDTAERNIAVLDLSFDHVEERLAKLDAERRLAGLQGVAADELMIMPNPRSGLIETMKAGTAKPLEVTHIELTLPPGFDLETNAQHILETIKKLLKQQKP